jgi:hypothetical protein
VGLTKYLKAAFLNRWNLLAVLAGSGFALLSGRADVALPLVWAAEVAWLGLLGTHPRFQKYVDAQDAAATRSATSQAAQRSLQRILTTLPPKLIERFRALRGRCLELQQIAGEMKHPAEQQLDRPLEDSQAAGLDRLLWTFLRMLFTHHALSRFLQKTDAAAIQRDVDRLTKRLAAMPAGEQDVQQQRVRKALEDNLAACHERLANLKKATDNLQLVELQIDQLENRIQSLSEMAVNRQEPDFISSQVDQVAASMVQTEQTMNELRFATGLEALSEETPSLLRPIEAKIVE